SRRRGAGTGTVPDSHAQHPTCNDQLSARRATARSVGVVYFDVRMECLARTGKVSYGLPFSRSSRTIPSRQADWISMTMTIVRDDLVNRLIRYPGAIASRLRIVRLRALGVRIGRKCWIRRIIVPRNPWDIMIDDRVALDDQVVLLTTGSRKNTPRL